MNKISLEKVIEKSQAYQDVIIVGAGKIGQQLLSYLAKNKNININAFFDNNELLINKKIKNIIILKPHKVYCNKCLYIIAVDAIETRKMLKSQLLELGIEEMNIITYFHRKDYDYYSTLEHKYYEEELSEMYRKKFGKNINWSNPISYNEIINWEKLNKLDSRKTQLADKYLVREWIKDKIGEQYLTKWYGVWDDANEIDFSLLPKAFVLKTNNGSARNIVVKNKSQMDINAVVKQLNEWKETNYAYTSFELQYKDIIPKIICEEYLEGVADNIYDYNIYCFHGIPKYIWCIKGSHRPECMASFYDTNWRILPFSYGYPKDPITAPRPEKLNEMLELSRILCKDFEHVRVDWYNLPDGRVLFCEMTFSTWGGLAKFEPEKYDLIFGEHIRNKKSIFI